VRRPADARRLEGMGVEIVRADLVSGQGVREAVRGVDVVHHLAAVLRAPNDDTYRRVNVDGTLRLYRALAEMAPRGRFVFLLEPRGLRPT